MASSPPPFVSEASKDGPARASSRAARSDDDGPSALSRAQPFVALPSPPRSGAATQLVAGGALAHSRACSEVDCKPPAQDSRPGDACEAVAADIHTAGSARRGDWRGGVKRDNAAAAAAPSLSGSVDSSTVSRTRPLDVVSRHTCTSSTVIEPARSTVRATAASAQGGRVRLRWHPSLRFSVPGPAQEALRSWQVCHSRRHVGDSVQR